MKKYIILTGAIRNAGGSQQYTANKLSYMESMGWKTYAFFHVAGDIKIKYLSKFGDYHFPELGRAVQTLSKRNVSKVVSRIVSIIGNDDEIVIESNSLSLSFWGEIIAKALNGKHVMFPLEEAFWKINKKEAAFLHFKMQRGEIMTGSKETRIRQLFQKYYLEEYKMHLMGLKVYCSNVVDYTPVEIPIKLQDESTKKILSIARLKKPYIIPMLHEIKEYVLHHSNMHFSLIMIGGDNDPSIEKSIRNIFSDVDNVELYMLGYVFPIPYDWIKISDVCIASSNSVLVSAEEGVPTISIDGHDLKAIGIYGFTTLRKVFRDNEPEIPIGTLLEDILIKKKYVKDIKKRNIKDEFGLYFKPHLDFLNASAKTKDYYNIEDVYSSWDCLIAKTKYYIRKKLK